MKKKVFLFVILFSLLFVIPFITTADNDSINDGDIAIDNSDDSRTQVEKAYDCLDDKVDECSTSLEDNIFTLLAIRQCKGEVLDEMDDDLCWPDGGCKIKPTAQAILALNKAGTNTNEAEDWLISQNKTNPDLIWYLQIDSSDTTTCTITYKGNSYQTTVQADKKISSGAGSCLSLSSNGYWLQVSPECSKEEFKIQCHDSSFMTSLLFKKKTSPTLYISSDPHSASAEGTTTEKFYSVCFGQGGICNYEGSLWAALALDDLDYDVSIYLPYLITMAEENKKYLPEAFIYLLTGYTDFRVDLLQKQQNNQFWREDLNKFYDTAVALYPFQDDAPQEKTNSQEWLLEIQGSDGCWGSIKDTAFILHSLWSDEAPFRGGSGDDSSSSICGDNNVNPGEQCDGTNFGNIISCSDFGIFTSGTLSCDNDCIFDTSQCIGQGGICGDNNVNPGEQCDGTNFGNIISCSDFGIFTSGTLSCDNDCIFDTSKCGEGSEDDGTSVDCGSAGYYCMSQFSCGGEILSGYSCSGVSKCCDTPLSLEDSCSDQGGEICGLSEECSISTTEVADTYECCLGYCREVVSGTDESDCGRYGGDCRSSCFEDEEETTDECSSFSDVCCVGKTTPPKSYLWIWILLILIILIILGIIFREKLRPYWFRLKSMFGKNQSPGWNPRYPMASSRIPFRRPIPRRILPPSQGPPVSRPLPPKKDSSEIDDVLKKLKDMGK